MTAQIPRPVDFSQHRHIWCVGCSFTHYTTDTWADHLAQQYPVTNLGQEGAGNQYIFQTLWELEHSGQLQDDDLLMVQWSSVFRESRRYRGKWKLGGNLWGQVEYPREFVRDYCDPREFYLRDMSLIRATQVGLLDRYAHHEFSMCPMEQVNQYHDRQMTMPGDHSRVLDRLLPSFYDVLWDGSIQSHEGDGHPTPEEHLLYLERVFDWRPHAG